MSESQRTEQPLANAQPDAARQRLQVASVTGIDWSVAIAGLGGRSYAFVVDWHIRVVGALAWFALSNLVLYGDVLAAPRENRSLFFFGVAAPALAIYLLYHPVLEVAMRGRTPGKRLAGIRIVTSAGQVPDASALAVRNVLRIVDSLPGLYAIGLASALLTRQSVRIGDLAAGTVLVYEADDTNWAAFDDTAVARIGLERMELVRELLHRWNDLRPDHRALLAAKLLRQIPSSKTDAAFKAALEEELR